MSEGKNSTGMGESLDNMASGAVNAAKTAGQIAQKAGKLASETAKAGAAAAANTGTAAASAAAGSAAGAGTVAAATAAGTPGGPIGMAIGAAAGLIISFKDEIYKLLMVLGFATVFIIILVASLPNVVMHRLASENNQNSSVSGVYSSISDDIQNTVQSAYSQNLSAAAGSISAKGLSVSAESLSGIISGGGTYESGDTYLYISDPTKLIGLDYDASYIMAAYSASLLNIPDSSETENVYNGTNEKDMLGKLDTAALEMFSHAVSETTTDVLVPAEYFTYSSIGTVTYVKSESVETDEDGTESVIRELATKEFYTRDSKKASTDKEITIDNFTFVSVKIPVPTATGREVYITKYYYEKNGKRTITPTTKTLKYITCTLSNFNQNSVLSAFGINEYASFGDTQTQFWEVIDSLKNNINSTIGLEAQTPNKVVSGSINGKYLSKNNVIWFRTDVNAEPLPELEEAPEKYIDDIPVFTDIRENSAAVKDFLPEIPDGTVARTVSAGIIIVNYPDGSSEKLYSSEYYSPQVSSFSNPLPYQDAYCSSDYGYRYINNQYKLHNGIDMCCYSGTLRKNVVATADGTVTLSTFNAYGNCVMIDHGNGITSLYGHLDSKTVGTGDVVKQGQVIGYAGTTYGTGGYSTGPHLHFEIRVNNERVNPRTYVDLPE